MKSNHERKIEVISGIDDIFLQRATEARLLLLSKTQKRNSALLSWVAVAACLVLVVGAMLAILPAIITPTPTPPTGQVPIYQGMTVSTQAPEVVQAHHGLARLTNTATASQDDGYYARKNQDIYIHVHLSNPDNFEILSFTLNGVKYSSYMFEDGSDMETLILKYNVGDVEGTQSYTIDAIKYVDGEDIKDVRMEGNRTVQVRIYPENQPVAQTDAVTADYASMTITTSITDPLYLISQSQGQLYARLYLGDDLVEEIAFNTGEAVAFQGLIPNTTYRYVVVAVYNAIDGQGYVPHVLLESTYATKELEIFEDVAVQGLTATFEINDAITVETLALYEGDVLYGELPTSAREIQHLPFDKALTLAVTYTLNETSYQATYDLPVITESQGLMIVNGLITDIGTCTDTELYLNHPIDETAFNGVKYITKVYMGEGVTSIGQRAFALCEGITELYFGEGVVSLGQRVFSSCTSLTKVVIPQKFVTALPAYLFYKCSSLHIIELPDCVEEIGENCFTGTRIAQIILNKNVPRFPEKYLLRLPQILYRGTAEEWAQDPDSLAIDNLDFSKYLFQLEVIYDYTDEMLEEISYPAIIRPIGYMVDEQTVGIKGVLLRGWVQYEYATIASVGYRIQGEEAVTFKEGYKTGNGQKEDPDYFIPWDSFARFSIFVDLTHLDPGTYYIDIFVKLDDGTELPAMRINVVWE